MVVALTRILAIFTAAARVAEAVETPFFAGLDQLAVSNKFVIRSSCRELPKMRSEGVA
ncbi:hypothetical protein ACFSHT_33715 [Paraburkholderia silviterrae]|uniref:hypothetical protein n=1 Tax=Paraburkholderia silviterrae TaxID=2528715 RepID=UPI001405160C